MKWSSLAILGVLAAGCDGPVGTDPGQAAEASAFVVQEGWPRLPDGMRLGRVLGVAVHPDGRVFVSHAAGRESPNDEPIDEPVILVFDPKTGELLDSLGAGLFLYPHSLTFDPAGRLWVTDSDANRVVRLDEAGQVDLVLGAAGAP